MKTFRQLREDVENHDNYNDWQERARLHKKFARFATAQNIGYKEHGSKKLTVFALDHESNPIGVYSHVAGRGTLDEGAFSDFVRDTKSSVKHEISKLGDNSLADTKKNVKKAIKQRKVEFRTNVGNNVEAKYGKVAGTLTKMALRSVLKA